MNMRRNKKYSSSIAHVFNVLIKFAYMIQGTPRSVFQQVLVSP